MAYFLAITTAPDRDTAETIARHLVDERLAACCNIVPDVVSVFRWENEIQSDSEVIVFVKTEGNLYPAVEARIKELHPYDVPEIIALEIERGDSAYLDWVSQETNDH